MRQVRIRSDRCSTQRIQSVCQDDYQSSNEETRSFQPGWIDNDTLRWMNTSIDRAFQYRSSSDLNAYPYLGDHGRYGGGGYLYECRGRLADLRANLSALHRFSWIDDRTRAVIIQLSFYNPNVQLFTSRFIVTEFLSNGGLRSHLRL